MHKPHTYLVAQLRIVAKRYCQALVRQAVPLVTIMTHLQQPFCRAWILACKYQPHQYQPQSTCCCGIPLAHVGVQAAPAQLIHNIHRLAWIHDPAARM